MEGKIEKEFSPERGKNVKIVLKMIRHGERTKEGLLTDYGRKITKERAREGGIKSEEFGAIKAVGSNAGPKGPTGMERALETANIYAKELAGEKAFQTRIKDMLSYETLKSSPPYDHLSIYNSNLPDNFKELSDQEKVIAAKKANEATINHLISLHTPEAEMFKKEIAGAFAYFVEHYEKMTNRLKSDSKVLMPSGTHGGLIEPFLQQTLVRQLENGEKVLGFKKLEEIGGDFDPSEAFDIEIGTDAEGNHSNLRVVFDNPSRPKVKEAYLDREKLYELSKYYQELHKKEL